MGDEKIKMIGTVVGISKPTEFLMAVAPEEARLQDIVAVDTEEIIAGKTQKTRVWGKITDVERINPLFPREAAQQLAYERLDAMDALVSLSKEMITAKCKIIGIETGRELKKLDYPIKPTSSVYFPSSEQVQQVISGDLPDHRHMEIGFLRARNDVKVIVDALKIVSRHLGILAMTGAGKTYTCRRIIEELTLHNNRRYPILIFDPHNDYVGLKKIKELEGRVNVYYPDISLTNKDDLTLAISIVDAFNPQYPLSETQNILKAFQDIFDICVKYLGGKNDGKNFFNRLIAIALERADSVLRIRDNLDSQGLTLETIVNLSYLIRDLLDEEDKEKNVLNFLKDFELFRLKQNTSDTYNRVGIKTYIASKRLEDMRYYNKKNFEREGIEEAIKLPEPKELGGLIEKGKVSIISLTGYDDIVKCAFVSIILDKLFRIAVEDEKKKFLTIIDEAHTFVPGAGEEISHARNSTASIKRVATEGRKFGVGLVLISQRPSRVNSTVLSQCNSFIIQRIVNPYDQRYIREIMETAGKEEIDMLPELSTGDAILTGQFVRFPVVAHITEPESKEKYVEDDYIKDYLEDQTQ